MILRALRVKPQKHAGFEPRQQHRPALKSLLANVSSKQARNRALAAAYLKHGYTLTEIGREAGLHYATVSRLVKAVEAM